MAQSAFRQGQRLVFWIFSHRAQIVEFGEDDDTVKLVAELHFAAFALQGQNLPRGIHHCALKPKAGALPTDRWRHIEEKRDRRAFMAICR